jgi:transposase
MTANPSNAAVLRKALEDLPKEQLITLILQQADRISELSEQVERLGEQVTKLTEQIEELERTSHRQAAPFRRDSDKKVAKPKKPGRKTGHKGFWRQPPSHIDEEIEVLLEGCPTCGGQLSDMHPIEQIIEEIPPITPRCYKLTTYRGQCPQCGPMHSTHPLKTSQAQGAAKVQLGPRAKAIALKLNYAYGLSKRKTQAVMEQLCGLRASPAGWHYGCWRLAQKCKATYQRLIEQARQSDYLHCDETSWYMGGVNSWLWVFTNADHTLYKVAGSRGRQELQQVIGTDYKGVLISDCLNIYDDVNPVQQKCYAHHLKAISQAKTQYGEDGSGFLDQVERLLKTAIVVKQVSGQVPTSTYQQACIRLEEQADRLLVPSRADPIEEKIANRLRKQRDHLFTFLYIPQVPPTNNRAERQLRPAVIARKLSCGNKTRKGADTWQTLTSLIVTNSQNRINNLDYFQEKAIFTGS